MFQELLLFLSPLKLALYAHPLSTLSLLASGLSLSLIFLFKKKLILINACLFFLLLSLALFIREIQRGHFVREETKIPQEDISFINSEGVMTPGTWASVLKLSPFLEKTESLTATYTIEETGFRKSPPLEGHAQSQILALGCSFTFGSGSNDDETYPALLQKEFKDIRVINMGVPGGTTQHVLSYLQKNRDLPLVDKKIPVKAAIYSFIPGHFGRNLYRMLWQFGGPRLELNPKGELEAKEDFSLGKDLNFSLWLYRWKDFFTMSLGLPIKISSEEYELFFALIKESQKNLLKKYPGIQLYIFDIVPYDKDDKLRPRLINDLKKENIIFIPAMPGIMDCPSCFLPDRHLSVEGNRKIALYLASFFKGKI